MNKLRVGIAGYGIVGKRRRECVDRNINMELVAVCDRSFPADGSFPDGVRYYRDYKYLLAESLDVLIVCLTNDIAPRVTMAALEANLHVFCEKPPGRDVSDIKAVIECEAKNPKFKLMYGFNHRYHDSVRDAQTIIESGQLGDNGGPQRGVYAVVGLDEAVTTVEAAQGRTY